MDIAQAIYTEERKKMHSDDRKLISILKTASEEGRCKIEVDEEALKTVFEKPEIANLPIMLLSVTGAFRKGKSFLLNFFLRYLRKKGHQTTDNWLGNEDMNDGFEWKGGKQPLTQGIIVFNEVFIVSMNGQKTAVFLMDTQGLFDNNSDKRLCTQIFAFSTLLSSVQVFNISQQIQENDLEYLQCFTEYARVVQIAKASDKQPPFQKFMFVIRDWQELGDHDYGADCAVSNNGKRGYLAGVLSSGSKNKELTMIRQHLRSSFADLGCFLMPHPGMKVAVSSSKRPFNGALKDIGQEFLDNAKILADCLLNPKNCVPKKIHGKTITASSLVNYAIECSRTFASGRIPEPQTMLKTAATVMNLEALKVCTERYDEIMKTICTEYLSDEKLIAADQQAKCECDSLFEENTGFGDKEIRKIFHLKLYETLRNHHLIYRKSNEAKGREIFRKVRENANDEVKKFALKMEKVAKDGTITDKVFVWYYKKFQAEAIDYFVTQNSGKFGFKDSIEILETDLRFAGDVLKRQNAEKYELEKFRKQRMELDLYQVLSKQIESYKSAMSKFQLTYVDWSQLAKAHNNAKHTTTKAFTLSVIEFRGAKVQIYMDKLTSFIDKEYENIATLNETNKRMLEMTLDQKICFIVLQYLTIMSEGITDGYVLTKVLSSCHKETSDRFIQKLYHDKDVAELCWQPEQNQIISKYCSDLRAQLNKQFEEIKSLNESNRGIFPKTKSAVVNFFSQVVRSRKNSTETYL